MKKTLSIYLAGSIQKGHEQDQGSYWTDQDMDLLKLSLAPYEVVFLNPAFRSDDLSDQRSVFGRDMLQVYCSDVVFVDARHRRGLGVGAEMMWAKLNHIPLVIWAPKDTHYHKSQTTLLGIPVENWCHPFVESLGDKIVGDLKEGAEWIRSVKEGSCEIPIKGIESVEAAMLYYKEMQMATDLPMRALFDQHQDLAVKLQMLESLSLSSS